MIKKWTTEEKTRRWEHHRALKNLMGKYMLSLLLNREKNMFQRFWSQSREDVCLGFNDGWYSGREAIERYYLGVHNSIVRTSHLMQTLYPMQLGGKTDEEIFGAGPYNAKPVSNAVLEIAGDEQTAKGIWYSRGSSVQVTISGTVSYWTWGVYAVDFIFEEDEWKLWHVQYLEDINVPCGQSWGRPAKSYPPIAGYEMAAFLPDEIPKPNIPMQLRAYYHPDRPFTPLPAYPEPYNTFAETFTYGLKERCGE